MEYKNSKVRLWVPVFPSHFLSIFGSDTRDNALRVTGREAGAV